MGKIVSLDYMSPDPDLVVRAHEFIFGNLKIAEASVVKLNKAMKTYWKLRGFKKSIRYCELVMDSEGYCLMTVINKEYVNDSIKKEHFNSVEDAILEIDHKTEFFKSSSERLVLDQFRKKNK